MNLNESPPKEENNEAQKVQNLAPAEVSAASFEASNSVQSSNDANNKPFIYGASAALLVSSLGMFWYFDKHKCKSKMSKEKQCNVTIESLELKADICDSNFTVSSL